MLTAILVGLLSLFVSVLCSVITGYVEQVGTTMAGEYGSFTRSVETYTVIDTMLQHYLDEYHASRLNVSRFHNNVRDIANNLMFLVSTENVVTAPGVASNVDTVKDIPASTYSSILPQLMDKKIVVLKTDDIQTSSLREVEMHRGDRESMLVPVNDLSDRLIGFLDISWMSMEDVPNATTLPTMEAQLQGAADKIGAFLSHTR